LPLSPFSTRCFSCSQLDSFLIALHLIRYSTTPNCGLLEAGEEIDVVVTMAPLSQVRAHCQPPSDKKCQEYNSGKQHRRPRLSPLLLTSILLSMYVWDLQEKFDSFSANMSACQDKLLVRSSIVDEHVKVCPPRPLKEIRSFPSPLFLSSLLPVTQRSKNVPVSSLLLRLLSLLPSFPPSLLSSFETYPLCLGHAHPLASL